MTLPQLITISPNPIPSVPAWVLVCYNFDDGASSPVILEVDLTGTPYEFRTEVSKENPCVRVYVPAGCSGVVIVDTTMQSQDAAAPVLPD